MATNLTTQKVKDTYDQLLHVDGGPAATGNVALAFSTYAKASMTLTLTGTYIAAS